MDALSKAADFFYDVCELYEDEDLDRSDSVAILQRAFSSSDCDDLAFILHRLTGWNGRRASWTIPTLGFGHHTFLAAPNGRFLDITGWTDAATLRKRYCPRGRFSIQPWQPSPQSDFDPADTNPEAPLSLILGFLPLLPYPPYNEDWFQKVTSPLADAFRTIAADDDPQILTIPTSAGH